MVTLTDIDTEFSESMEVEVQNCNFYIQIHCDSKSIFEVNFESVY